MEKRPMCLLKKKREKEKKKKRKIIKIATLCLETRARSEGYMAKAFKARCPKPLRVGSHRLSVRYMGGWVEFSKILMIEIISFNWCRCWSLEIIRSPG